MSVPIKLIVRHWNSTLANEIQEFPLEGTLDVLVGRDAACTLRFHPHLEDMVSRKHARLVAARDGVTITDLNSRNGTFVNRRRVNGATPVHAGDVIQFSPGGPEITIDFDSRRDPAPAGLPEAIRASFAKNRAFVSMVVATTLLLGIAGGVAVVHAFARLSGNRASHSAVVSLESTWRLVDRETGKRLFQVYSPNRTLNELQQDVPIAAGAGTWLPVFVSLGNRIEPMLTTSDGGGNFHPIGSNPVKGAGVVTTAGGLVLTTRQVAAPWLAAYRWEGESAGLLVAIVSKNPVTLRTPIPAQVFPMDWVPENPHYVIEGVFDAQSMQVTPIQPGTHRIRGELESLQVTIAKKGQKLSARLVSVHPSKDLAVVEVNGDQHMEPAKLRNALVVARAGDVVSVAGQSGDVAASIARVPGGRDNDRTEEYHLRIQSHGSCRSGSPVLDHQGRVIAILASPLAWDASAGLAVPILYGMDLMRRRPSEQE